ncbi:endophilin-B2 isoform X14 [Sagmatias obliquidens]|uniref:endophilin-B2 isoform X14 n=1 Tax=Sagmatias obliquidens TaxID=3371155 RepID=UPI000F441633|nr:endophilin-B2 isoform X14 [Lagenorhynchus obliquidens]
MDFNMKKLASDAGIFFTRAVQKAQCPVEDLRPREGLLLCVRSPAVDPSPSGDASSLEFIGQPLSIQKFTEEKFGQAEKTELDAQFENLLARADSTKNWTEKILRQTEVLLQPNPSARVEEFLYEKLDRKVPSRVTNGELLAQYMAEAASELGPTTPYGKTLIKVAEAEKRLGAAERDFIHTASIGFLTPLRTFLEGDWKTISKERRLLHNRRLDLDACKARLKKAKAAEAKATAEQELRVAQTEFDRQAEVTRLLLEGISSTHISRHLRGHHRAHFPAPQQHLAHHRRGHYAWGALCGQPGSSGGGRSPPGGGGASCQRDPEGPGPL